MSEAIAPTTDPARCCATCEYWDAGGRAFLATAKIGDCHNPNSDRFTPERDHVCSAYYPDTTEDQVHPP